MKNVEKLKKLVSALIDGKQLYRIHHNDETCKEYFWIETYKDQSYFRVHGWTSAIGKPLDRLEDVFQNPDNWNVE